MWLDAKVHQKNNISEERDMKVIIINGPNLNLLGTREPGIYGTETMESYLTTLRKRYPSVEIEYYQSNVEGELINKCRRLVSLMMALY